TLFKDDNGHLQFKVHFFKMAGHAIYRSRTLNGLVIGKVEHGELVEFGYHFQSTVQTGSFYMLSKCIGITKGSWIGKRGIHGNFRKTYALILKIFYLFEFL